MNKKKFSRKQNFIFNLVGLGGTFDRLHSGHKLIIKRAFQLGKKVAIALTTEKLLKKKERKDLIEIYSIRKKKIEYYIENELKISKDYYEIIELNDPFGSAIEDKKIEAHVSSAETYKTAIKINKIRIEKGLKPLTLVIIPMVQDQNRKRISSSNIRKNLKKINLKK